jgi:hypothetical protein
MWGNTTFRLWTNSGLTSPHSGLLQLKHNTDLSDNPQDTQFWFGSVATDLKLVATSNPGVDNIVISIVDILPVWEATTAYAVGQLIQPTTSNDLFYRCITAGTSGGTEPTWPTTGVGSTVADGTVIWRLEGNKHDTDEVTLALTEAALDTNTPGDPLSIGHTVQSGVANAVEIWVRVDNAVTSITNTTGFPHLALSVNQVIATKDV